MGEKERFLPLATVRKTFGRGGELILKFRPDVPQNIIDQLSKEEPVFIQVDGIPVPFYFTSVTLRGNDQALVSFENYLTETLAAEWVGKTLLYKAGESATPSGVTLLVGYTFRAKAPEGQKRRGTVTNFFDYPGNPCLELEFEDGTRTLLPFHEDFIRKISHRNHFLELVLPEGL
ncbi:MAG: hypothetical protein PHT64_07110 [Bacteroidales bacterium]|nr:hypothetical protein [Bacteroidales bacterium]MDD4029867.1 hypothetical protein [Bacteroidales bacterium]MDD4434947.1 hypothetical protein [Bacteroidales bacterium]MDD5733547.1 hypothetical protein [Bacteroidales bacterium]